MRKFFIFAFLLSGCSNNSVLENISEYDYEMARGHNAALIQFAEKDMLEDMLIDLSNKRVIKYTDGEDNSSEGYTEGYHSALELLPWNKNTCTR